jgi:protease I
MATDLSGKRVAIVATDGFEQSELFKPLQALRDEGASVDIVAPKSGTIQGMQHHEKGEQATVDKAIDEVSADDYDALVLPGGVVNPDQLRTDDRIVAFIKSFMTAKKPVGAICHGPWTLIEADAVRGRKMTSWPSLKTDLKNAGANWIDQEVVVDKGLVTSRKPADLPAFCRKLVEEIAEGQHVRRKAEATA